MRMKIIITCLLSVTVLLNSSTCFSEDDKNDGTLEIVSECTYKIGPGDSKEKYESLCLFGAKYKVVDLSAKYLAHKGLLENYGQKQKEIFCLVTDELKAVIIEKRIIENGKSYYVKIKTGVTNTDFIKAEIKNLELEQEENNFSWREEKGQHVFKSIDPGQELSRAY